MMGNVRFAGRTLRRTPQFTVVAILSLGLGLAVTASTIAVVNLNTRGLAAKLHLSSHEAGLGFAVHPDVHSWLR